MVPVTARVNAGPPAVAAAGVSRVTDGAAGLIVKVRGLEAACPGFITATVATPGCAISPAPTAAVSWVELRKLVVSEDPFHCTTTLGTKPDPFTASVKAAPPAVAEFGLTPETTTLGSVTTNVRELEVVPATTSSIAIDTLPGEAIRDAGTLADTWFKAEKVFSLVPFHVTTMSGWKPVPATVMLNAGPPAGMVLGVTLSRRRLPTPGVTVTISGFPVTLPGFNTVT